MIVEGLGAGTALDGAATGADQNVWFTDHGATSAIAELTYCYYCLPGEVTPAITEFSTGLNTGSDPGGITAGAEGNLWFTDHGSTPAIGRITPTGTITEYSTGLNPGSDPQSIAAGPEGNLWFTDDGSTRAIGRITPTGTITEYSTGLNPGSNPQSIAAGPEGNLWFTDDGSTRAIGRITPTGTITEYSTGLNPGSDPQSIAAGPEGNLWFTDDGSTPTVGRSTPTGVITEFAAPPYPYWGRDPFAIAAGPSGNLWVTNLNSEIGQVEVTPPCEGCSGPPLGPQRAFTAGLNTGSIPTGITAGPDGNMWFTDEGTKPAIGRITTPPTVVATNATVAGPGSVVVSGTVDGHSQPTSLQIDYYYDGRSMTCYSSECEWHGASIISSAAQSVDASSEATSFSVTLSGLPELHRWEGAEAREIRAIATNPTATTLSELIPVTFPAGPGPSPSTPVTTRAVPPTVSDLSQTHNAWREGHALASDASSNRRAPLGTVFSFTLNEQASVTLAFVQQASGREVDGKCRATDRKNRKSRACKRTLTRGTASVAGRAGTNRVSFQGRTSQTTRLTPGTYTLEISAGNTAGQSKPESLRFTIVH